MCGGRRLKRHKSLEEKERGVRTINDRSKDLCDIQGRNIVGEGVVLRTVSRPQVIYLFTFLFTSSLLFCYLLCVSGGLFVSCNGRVRSLPIGV